MSNVTYFVWDLANSFAAWIQRPHIYIHSSSRSFAMTVCWDFCCGGDANDNKVNNTQEKILTN
jgi:hypothetical protein